MTTGDAQVQTDEGTREPLRPTPTIASTYNATFSARIGRLQQKEPLVMLKFLARKNKIPVKEPFPPQVAQTRSVALSSGITIISDQ